MTLVCSDTVTAGSLQYKSSTGSHTEILQLKPLTMYSIFTIFPLTIKTINHVQYIYNTSQRSLGEKTLL